ncbi:MAG: twin-arginine translocase subunit TatC, partial [FCB group bacterium]|nr:twin-arginine translocase subunit TatC [FCB group bacterium]
MSTEEARMTFTEHLAELRRRLIVSVVVILISCGVCFFFSKELFELIRRPLNAVAAGAPVTTAVTTPATPPAPLTPGVEAPGPADVKWTALNPIEPIWVLIQVAIYAGLFFSLPVVIYQICAFV